MPGLVDTTIRLLSEKPLADSVGSGRLLEIAKLLDGAGFETLEVSGGGCFEHLVDRGIESPWERIRSLSSRCTTPLGMALRGRFLVGSRPLSPELVRRFVACAATSGVDVFRIHDPLNDPANLREAAEAVAAAGKTLVIGLLHNPLPGGDYEDLAARARELTGLGAARLVIDDPAGSLDASRAREMIEHVREASGLPVGLHCQGAAGRALATSIEAARDGATPIGVSSYPVAATLFRPSAEAVAETLAGLDLETGVDVEQVWAAAELIADSLEGVETPPLLPPAGSVRAARRGLPNPLIIGIADALRAQGLEDRLDDVLDELDWIREAAGSPPLVAPIGQILGSQALLHVLSAKRWSVVVDDLPALLAGDYGRAACPVREEASRALELRRSDTPADVSPDIADLRESASGVAASEEELLLLALFGERAELLLQNIRARADSGEDLARAGVENQTADRVRELIDIVEDSGIGEVTVEEGDVRVTVRRNDLTDATAPSSPGLPEPTPDHDASTPARGPEAASEPTSVESPMVGTFYRSPEPGAPPFVEVGDTVSEGQTLCILEAMKLMNEVTSEADAIVRRICVENAEAVEFGQVLFELESLLAQPLDGI